MQTVPQRAKLFTGLVGNSPYSDIRIILHCDETYGRDFVKLFRYGLSALKVDKWNRYDRPKSYRKMNRK